MTPEIPTQVLAISPVQEVLDTSVRVPGSKSLTNRALLIAALADGFSTLTNALFSDDSFYFANALQNLGFRINLEPENTCITVCGLRGEIPSESARLFIGNAGTAARFLTAFLTLGKGEFIVEGDARMHERPIVDLVDALQQLGAILSSLEDDDIPSSLPLKISAAGLTGGRAEISGNISSQFLSALLMVAPYASQPVEIEVTTELASKPYIDMTLGMMADFGVQVEREGYRRFLIRPARYSARRQLAIEPDATAASYFFAAPALCGGRLLVEGIRRQSSQGDIAFLNVLARMGCTITEKENGIEVCEAERLIGVDVDMRDISDTAQTLAVLAPFAQTPTCIHGIASARLKETDRISATCTELRRIGVQVEEFEDGMCIHPCVDFRPAVIQTYNDHRMAMAFSLIGLRLPGISIENPACVSKTFPDFFRVLEELR
jgi:3-phosphoshikimate 1-carboxyvinyltransferase